MNRDNLEGAGRTVFGQGEQLAGNLLKDKSTAAQGRLTKSSARRSRPREAQGTRSRAGSTRPHRSTYPGFRTKSPN
jgi:hypothetical protein